MTTARLFTILSAISWASLYVLGSHRTTFDVGCFILFKLTTFCCCSLEEGSLGTFSGSSTYSYSYSSSTLKKELNLYLKIMFSHHLVYPTKSAQMYMCLS